MHGPVKKIELLMSIIQAGERRVTRLPELVMRYSNGSRGKYHQVEEIQQLELSSELPKYKLIETMKRNRDTL